MQKILIYIIFFPFCITTIFAQVPTPIQPVVDIKANLQLAKSIGEQVLTRMETLNRLDQSFQLTKGYYDRLEKVSKNIQSWQRVSEILAMSIQTIEAYNQTKELLANNQYLNEQEVSEILLASGKVLTENKKLVKDLSMATKYTGMSLTDKDRYDMIQGIHTNIENHYAAVKWLNSQIELVIEARRSREYKRNHLF